MSDAIAATRRASCRAETMLLFFMIVCSLAAFVYVVIAGFRHPFRKPVSPWKRRYWRLGRQAALAILLAGIALFSKLMLGIDAGLWLLVAPIGILVWMLWSAARRFRASDPWRTSSRSSS